MRDLHLTESNTEPSHTALSKNMAHTSSGEPSLKPSLVLLGTGGVWLYDYLMVLWPSWSGPKVTRQERPGRVPKMPRPAPKLRLLGNQPARPTYHLRKPTDHPMETRNSGVHWEGGSGRSLRDSEPLNLVYVCIYIYIYCIYIYIIHTFLHIQIYMRVHISI